MNDGFLYRLRKALFLYEMNKTKASIKPATKRRQRDEVIKQAQLVAGNKVLVDGTYYAVAPTSCRCGGNLAWVRYHDDSFSAFEMVGCICHHTIFGDVSVDHIKPYGPHRSVSV